MPVFFASIFIIPVRMINHTAVLQVYHKNNIIFKGAVIDLLLAIALLAILYRPLGLPGVALAFVLSSYIQAGYYLKHSSTLLKIPMGKLHPFGTMAGLFIFSLLSMGGCYMLCRGLSNFYSLMFGLICTTGLALGFFLFFYKKKYI
ncbi:MAG: hypothetical protein EOO13_17945 [Chitinophagaceae bacterium]|nr:MAG: hypothetical protein EOO13_17945 [Chitinophagaceae bacterium]